MTRKAWAGSFFVLAAMTTSDPASCELIAAVPDMIAMGTSPAITAWLKMLELPMKISCTSSPFSLKSPASLATHTSDWPTPMEEYPTLIRVT